MPNAMTTKVQPPPINTSSSLFTYYCTVGGGGGVSVVLEKSQKHTTVAQLHGAELADLSCAFSWKEVALIWWNVLHSSDLYTVGLKNMT